MKKYLFSFLFAVIASCCCSQTIDTVVQSNTKRVVNINGIGFNPTTTIMNIKDTDTVFFNLRGDMSAFVRDLKPYTCTILRKQKIKNGYVLRLLLHSLDDLPLSFPINAVFPDATKDSYKDIKIGDMQPIVFFKYNKVSPHSDFENGEILDLLFGESIVSVYSNEIMKNVVVGHFFHDSKQNSNSYLQLSDFEYEHVSLAIREFLKFIVYEDNGICIQFFLDIDKVRNSLKQWSVPFYDKIQKNYYPQQYYYWTNQRIKKVRRLLSNCELSNSRDLLCIMKQYFKNEYNIINQDYKVGVDSIKDIIIKDIEVLYKSDDTYTLRIQWNLFDSLDNYYIELSIKKESNLLWKIVAINRLNSTLNALYYSQNFGQQDKPKIR